MASRVIRVELQYVFTGGAQVQKQLQGVGQAANTTNHALRQVKIALASLISIQTLRSITNLSDAYVNVSNRIGTVTENASQQALVLKELFGIARTARTEFAAVGQTFGRLSETGKLLGFSQKEVLTVTDTLTKAIAISGLTAREAAAGLIQFSQGMSRGVLRGDELRSVLEQFPPVADILAEKLKTTRFGLAALGEKGAITAKIAFEALLEANRRISASLAATTPTISQAFTVLRNSAVQFIGELNKSTGIFTTFAQGILFLADNFDILLRAIIAVTLAIGVGLAGNAIPLAIKAFGLLQKAIAAAGLSPMGAAIAAIVILLVTFSDKIQVVGDAMFVLGDIFRLVFGGIVEVLGWFRDTFTFIFEQFSMLAGGAASSVITLFRPVVDFIQFVAGALARLPGVKQLVEAGSLLKENLQVSKELAAQKAAIAKSEEEAAKRALEIKPVAAPSAPTPNEEKFSDIIRRMREENEALKLNTREREISNEVIKIGAKFKGGLSEAQKTLVRGLLEEKVLLEDQAELFETINGATDTYAQKTRALNALFASGRITLAQYNEELRNTRMELLATKEDFGSGVERGLLQVQKEIGDIASLSESAVVNAFHGMEDALVEFVQTGKLSFADLADSIVADLTRIAVRQAILAPLAGLLFGSQTGGGGGLLGGGLNALFGGGQPNGQPAVAAGDPTNFANGGAFTVGGAGGTDSQLVRFRATPGEEVTVRKKGDNSSRPVHINFNISTPDADSFKRSQGDLMARGLAVAQRAQRRNG